MKKWTSTFFIFVAGIIISSSMVIAQSSSDLSDDQIKELIINASIASYSGNCPCPYNLASNGSRCGERSAYSRPGGASPICYKNDISDREVVEFRKILQRRN